MPNTLPLPTLPSSLEGVCDGATLCLLAREAARVGAPLALPAIEGASDSLVLFARVDDVAGAAGMIDSRLRELLVGREPRGVSAADAAWDS